MCLGPYLGYIERCLRVVLEICRIDVLFVGSGVCHFGVRYFA